MRYVVKFIKSSIAFAVIDRQAKRPADVRVGPLYGTMRDAQYHADKLNRINR